MGDHDNDDNTGLYEALWAAEGHTEEEEDATLDMEYMEEENMKKKEKALSNAAFVHGFMARCNR